MTIIECFKLRVSQYLPSHKSFVVLGMASVALPFSMPYISDIKQFATILSMS